MTHPRRAAALAAAFFVSMASLPVQAAAADGYSWRNVQMHGGGFVSGLLFSPLEAGLLYARTDVGGAYRFDAAAGHWVPLQDALTADVSSFSDTGVLSLALDPVDKDRVYLAVGLYTADWWPADAAVLESTDRGAHWTRHPLPFKLGGNEDGRGCGERLLVDPRLPATLYLGTTRDGLWRSRDRAKTWTKMAGFKADRVTFVYADPASARPGGACRHLLAGVGDPALGLLESRDAGRTWKRVSGFPEGQMALRWDQAGRRVLITAADGIGPNGAHSGGLWALNLDTRKLSAVDVPAGMGGFSGISSDPRDPKTLLLSTLDRWNPQDDVFRSLDGGKTWKSVLLSGKRDTLGTPYAQAHKPHWLADLKLDPFNPDRAVFTTGYGVWASRDLRQADQGRPVTWDFEDQGLEEIVPLDLASPPWGAAPLYSAVGDQYGFTHTDLDRSPAHVPGEPEWGTSESVAYASKKPGILARASHDHRSEYSRDGGRTWTAFPTQLDQDHKGPGTIAISADGKAFVWCPDGRACGRSTDLGASWKDVSGLPPNAQAVADQGDPRRFYACDVTRGAFYFSRDRGATFRAGASGLPSNGDPKHVDLRGVPGRPGSLWLGLDQGLYASADGGARFQRIAGVDAAPRIGFGAPKPGQNRPSAYLAGTVGHVYGFYRSDDLGATWTRINDEQHNYGWINAITGDGQVWGRVYLATGGRGILVGEPDKP